jgi:hypothetical protein
VLLLFGGVGWGRGRRGVKGKGRPQGGPFSF